MVSQNKKTGRTNYKHYVGSNAQWAIECRLAKSEHYFLTKRVFLAFKCRPNTGLMEI